MATLTQRPKQMEAGIVSPLEVHRPVLALTLLRGDSDGPLALGVRTPKANSTHQDVLSVPTMRVPTRLAASWRSHIDATQLPDDLGVREISEALAARKLGLADPLELGQATLAVKSLRAWQGESLIDWVDGEDVTEQITMFNATVIVTRGGELLPERTASYSPLLWVNQGMFLKIATTRDVSILGPGFDAINVCVRGLCVQTTCEVLRAV